MRKLLLIISIALFTTATNLFLFPTTIPTVERYYTSCFVLALIILAIADYKQFKITNKK